MLRKLCVLLVLLVALFFAAPVEAGWGLPPGTTVAVWDSPLPTEFRIMVVDWDGRLKLTVNGKTWYATQEHLKNYRWEVLYIFPPYDEV